ncbi:hypothetical protein SUGI_0174220 [Cryptomeria japonica]|uniref:uncharacterized protein At4g15970 n=1 Tax=Cryptomeria japonica TaxID=3369 RepID=UPI002408D537|nr:uncharacterized protein At4g15970 [Cryptomeria japonica]GLJ11671.1 hypothetical protein SUGI_0174220 [Cryptomeria japonica]
MTNLKHKHNGKDVVLILVCATVIGVAVSAIVHKAAITFNPFLPDAFSQTVNIFVSSTVTKSEDSSEASSAQNVVASPAPAPDPAPPAPPLDESDREEFAQNVVASLAPAPDLAPPAQPLDEFDRVLARTANANKTVILTALNGAWAEPNTMIDLFLESFRIGEGTQELLQNLLIVALDAKAYNRCREIHPHCYTLKTRGVDFSAEKVYMSDDYLKMMWTRLGFLGDILKRGYSFVFSDADIMWLRNPFTRFSVDADIQIASDRFNGNAFDVNNRPNGGYKYVRSNERTISFYKFWYMSRRIFPGQNEQDVLNILKFRRGFSRRGMKFMFLDTKYFGGFCERSEYLDDVRTMHANCCKGLKAKLIDLRQALDDWMVYRNQNSSSLNSTSLANVGQWKPPYACRRSWDI